MPIPIIPNGFPPVICEESVPFIEGEPGNIEVWDCSIDSKKSVKDFAGGCVIVGAVLVEAEEEEGTGREEVEAEAEGVGVVTAG